MAQTTSNIIVGAASVAIGSYTSDWNGVGDHLWMGVKNAVTTSPKNFRSWIAALPTAGTPVTHNGINGSCTFRDAGLTQEGVEIQYQPDFGEVEVDQVLDAAKLFKQRMTVSVATTMAEATLENLLVVWAQTDNTQYHDPGTSDTVNTRSAAYLVPGELGAAPVEKALLFVGNAPKTATSYNQRVYLASRALSVESSSHSYRRNEATVFPVTFRLLPDTNASYSAYGRVVDVSGSA